MEASFLIKFNNTQILIILSKMAMVMSNRSRRPEPAAIRVTKSHSISRADAEQLITSYIDSIESSSILDAAAEAAISAEGHSSSTVVDNFASAIVRNENVIGQLKRVQRNLRGLPPVLRNEETGEQGTEANQKNYQTNEDVEMLNVEENDTTVGSKRKQISAEERKRLKKERRKLEKRSKSLAIAAQATEVSGSDEE